MVTPAEVQIVNIVATGQTGVELDINELANDLDFPELYLKGPGLYLKFTETDPTLILARSGTYIITGADGFDAVFSVEKKLFDLLGELNIIDEEIESNLEVKNMVCKWDFEEFIPLEQLAVELGFEKIEYEPEQFPGLIYRSFGPVGVVLVFSTGKLIVTGIRDKQTGNELVQFIHSKLETL